MSKLHRTGETTEHKGRVFVYDKHLGWVSDNKDGTSLVVYAYSIKDFRKIMDE